MLTVLTLNLRFGLADDGRDSWQYRKQCFFPLFEKYPADFMGFQEANDFQIDFIHKILSEYQYIGQRSPSPDFWQNNVIFYKNTWTCTHGVHFFLSPTPNVPSRFRKSLWPRQCTIGMFKNSNRRLICVNTHLDFDESVQTRSAKLILKRLADLPKDIPVILIGDFNTTPFGPCYNIFTGKDQKPAVQEDNFKNAFKKPYPGTHHRFTGDTRGDHIDWILYRGNIVLKNGTVILDTFDGRYVSDHFPLCANFNWEVLPQN